MNKAELVAAMAAKADMTAKDAGKALEAFMAVAEETMKKGDKIQLVGFGSFEVKNRAARMGKNPQTGKPIKIPASKNPVFKAGKSFKEAIQ